MENVVVRKTRWGRRIGIALGVMVALLMAVYFVGTSAAFLKAVILPRAGKSMNAQITVDDASISPFSQVVLKNFRLQTTGSEPLVTANEVRLRYGLMDIVKGHINVDEATLDTPVVSIVKEADGSSNLDPLLKGEKKESKPSSGKKTDLNVKNVALKNGTVRITQKLKSGGLNVTELTGLNVGLDQLKTGGGGKLTIASDLRLNNRPAADSNDVLVAKINGSYDFSISPDLAPQSIKGSVKIQVTQGEGAFKEAGNLSANLDADVTPTEFKQVAFRFERAGQPLGQLRVHGPFDMAKMEGNLTVELLSLDRNVLNIAGGGMDFGNSTINSTNQVQVTKQATTISVEGRLAGKQLGVVRDQKPTPPVDLDFDYKLAADLSAKTAALDRLSLSVRHKNAEFLSAKLDRSMTLNWGAANTTAPEAAVRLVVTNLNLTDWNAMLGTNPPSGIVNAGLVALAQNNGKKLALDINARVTQLNVPVGTNVIHDAVFTLDGKGTVEDLKRVDIPDYRIALMLKDSPAFTAKGTLHYDVEKKDYAVQIMVDATLPGLMNQLQIGGGQVTSGTMNFRGDVKGSTNETQVTGEMHLAKLVTRDLAATLPTNGLAVDLNLDANMRGQAVDLRKLDLQLSPTKRADNRLQIQGKIDMATNNPAPGNLAIKSAGLDVTPYYDMFAGGKPAAAPASATTTTANTTAKPNVEPAAIQLPLKQFTSTVAIEKLFLREIAISNWNATMTISNNSVALNPLKLGINGAPVAGAVTLNLGVPGYAYDVALNLDRVPLEPFANSFQTNKAGQYKGFLIADAKIRGAGTTGVNLQKNLQGVMTFSATNLDLKIVGGKWKSILDPIALVLRVPELTQTPINWIDAKVNFADGKIQVQKAAVESEAFQAGVSGDIPIKPVLMESPLNLPVDLALRRSLAEKSRLVSSDTPTNAKYAPLPRFVTLKGTLDAPKSDTDELAIAKLLARAAIGLGGNAVSGNAKAALDLITGGGSSTNATGTNTSAVGKIGSALGGLLGGAKATNTVSTNAPATNAPVQNLLNIFKKPKP